MKTSVQRSVLFVAAGTTLLAMFCASAYGQRGGGGCRAMSGGTPSMPRETASVISLIPMTGNSGYPNPYAAMNYQREAARTYQAQHEQSYRWQMAIAQQQTQLRDEQSAHDAAEARRRERAKRLTEQREAEKAQRAAARQKNLERRAKSQALAAND